MKRILYFGCLLSCGLMTDVCRALTFDFSKPVCRGVSETNDYPEARFLVRLAAHGYVEKSFAIGEGQVGLLAYYWANPDGCCTQPKKQSFRIHIPAGFEFVDASFADPQSVVTSRKADGSSEVAFPMTTESEHLARKNLNGTFRLGVLVKSIADVRAEGDMTFQIEYEGVVASNVERTRLFTIPRVQAKLPKRYQLGVNLGGWYCIFPTERANESFARMMTESGATWLIPQARFGKALPAWRRGGIRTITPDNWWFTDQFRVGNCAGRPEDEKLVLSSTNPPVAYVEQYVCPRAVYNESEFFRTKTLPELAELLKGCDGLWANWEPEPLKGRACACAACELEARESGLQRPRFRSLQGARITKTLDRYVRRFSGGDKSTGLIPGVNCALMSDEKYIYERGYEMWVDDYAGSLRWMNPWGPYYYWDTREIYNSKGLDNCVAGQFIFAKNVRERVNKDYAPGKRPRLLAFPHASEAGGEHEWLTQPEWLELTMDAHFFNQWDACIPYYFPRGYDARYWRAFANAATHAAEYESFVLDGRRVDGLVDVIPTVRRTYPKMWDHLKWIKDIPLLQFAAYECDGARIVAVFNFCDTADAVFDLMARGLQGEYDLLVEGEDGSARRYSAERLKAGVRLSIGRACCRVITLTPVK